MAFGDLKGTLTGNGNSITASNSIAGSVVVNVGDLVFAVIAEQTSLTATTASDNLGNTYTAQNAGTLSSTVVSGRAYWSRVTVAGTLTSVTVVATSSTHDWAGFAAVLQGPFATSPLDANPANITTDVTSPFTCPATGTLAQASEAVVAWGVANQSTAWAATAPNLLSGNVANSTNVKVAIGTQPVSATTTVTPNFTAAANPTNDVLGTASFKAAPPSPFFQTDWPTARTAPAATNALSDQAIMAFVIPFNQTDWSKPFQLASVPSAAPAYNPNLYSVVVAAAPFSQYDWSRPFDVPGAVPGQQAYNPNLYPAVVVQPPFAQTDWPLARSVKGYPGLSDQAIWSLVIPFAQFDWSKTTSVRSAPPQPQPYNINIYAAVVVAAPFVAVDWSRPQRSVAAKYDPRESLNLNLFTNPVPVLNLDFSRPFVARAAVAPVIPYNVNLYTSGPVSIPFNQTDWPVAHRINGLPGLSDQAIWAFTVPFAQYDWSKPFVQPPSVGLTNPPVSIALTAPIVAAPFHQTDWSRPLKQYYKPPQIDGAIIDISQPFAQSDWSKPSAIRTSPTGPVPLNPNLFAVAAGAPFSNPIWSTASRAPPRAPEPVYRNINLLTNPPPFAQYDWSRPAAFGPSPAAPLPVNLSLTTVAAVQNPFVQTDWAVPQRLGSAVALPAGPNINLLANPAPFAQLDWSKPVRVISAPPGSGPVNIGLFTNPVPFAQLSWVAVHAVAPVTDNNAPNFSVLMAPPPPPQTEQHSKPFFATPGQLMGM